MTALTAAAVAVALASLDAACVGPLGLSRPLVLGAMLGLALGGLETAFQIGTAVELLSLDALPVGSVVPLHAPVAAGTALLLALGPAPLPAFVALPAGLAAGWAYRGVDGWLRRERCRWAENAACSRALARGAAAEFLAAAAFLLAAAWLLRPALGWALPRLPGFVPEGLAWSYRLAPWLGGAVLFKVLWTR